MRVIEHAFRRKNIKKRNFTIFSIILNTSGLFIVLYYLLQGISYYIIVYMMAGAAGFIIESIGTRFEMWEYYTKEKPPAISFFGWGSAVTLVMWFAMTLNLV
jgi:hypothetical protein